MLEKIFGAEKEGGVTSDTEIDEMLDEAFGLAGK